jgi:hypothetical protein
MWLLSIQPTFQIIQKPPSEFKLQLESSNVAHAQA